MVEELRKETAKYLSDEYSIEKNIGFINDNKNNALYLERALAMLNVSPNSYHKWLQKQKNKEIKQAEDEIPIIWEHELPDYIDEEKEWIIDKLIPTKSVCILTGKRGTLKTFITLSMAYAVASGNKFLGQFSTRKGGVLYLDKENGIGIMKTRTAMIKKGLKTREKHNIGFICFSQVKLDNLTDLCCMEKLIEKYKPTLLVVDTYRRSVKYDENDASKVSEFFVDTMRPLVEKYDISVILIHHNRKSSGYSGSIDEMDELRGSSDLANYSDIILKMERKGGNVILKQLKNRNAQEEPPIKINCVFDGETLTMVYEGEYKQQTRAEKCVESLIIWFAEYNKEEFTTGEIKEIAFKKGYKKNTFHNAIKILQDNGDIENIGKGRYKVLV